MYYAACSEYLSKSLFLFGEFGGNDYNFMLLAGKSIDEVKSYVPTVIDAIKVAAEVLNKQTIRAKHVDFGLILFFLCTLRKLTSN
jgi:hypothetical protein